MVIPIYEIDSKHFNDQAKLFSEKKMKSVLFKLDEIQKNSERIYQP